MTDERHQGYANYETFLVALDINNEKAKQDRCFDLCRQYATGQDFDLANAIKRWVADGLPGTHPPTLEASLLSAAVGKIDWLELARDFASVCREIDDAKAV